MDLKSLFKPFVIYSGIYLSLEAACVAQLQEAKRLEELEERRRWVISSETKFHLEMELCVLVVVWCWCAVTCGDEKKPGGVEGPSGPDL